MSLNSQVVNINNTVANSCNSSELNGKMLGNNDKKLQDTYRVEDYLEITTTVKKKKKHLQKTNQPRRETGSASDPPKSNLPPAHTSTRRYPL